MTTRVLLAALMLAIAGLVGVAAPASAHAELESSSPKDGAELETAPKQITFTFGEDLIEQGNAVTLTAEATGDRLEVGEAEVDGDELSVAWPDEAPSGEFTAAYRAVSADGHPIEGTVEFSVAEATIAASPAAATSPAASAAPVPVENQGATQQGQPEASVLAWVLGVGVVALIAALAATWVTRRRAEERP